ncbi:MAG: hypothetical protein ACOCP4_05580 [Candidatus Woesearchaeota archaeon]
MSKLRKRNELLPQTASKYKSIPVVIWNACHDCIGDRCPIHHRCEFCGQDDKCMVMYHYLDNVFSAALNIVGDRISEKEMHRIGLHLVPLYTQLVKFKITELGVESPTYVTDKGAIKMHPIYREIRSTIKMIDDMWASLGVRNIKGTKKEPKDIEDLIGDTSYYDDMVEEE